ncbi:YraN family protein [Brevibacterium sp. 91QC2O2]|uniref:YraN family protein n=1 Tax=Brevibacterium TaxID=1696 RepID=UPI00211BBE23|nr:MULTISPECIES: YraN family protein [unclassified Brevibacterium]MCQ9367771.1 YraN family protein [Brevibacterium sp. 91QC2O2]MCQ9384923.1 YraN family protein [Brevibacterium sp. 68QC2CO]
MTNQTVGRTGEDLATAFLEAKGWEIVQRNWRCRLGEIDIVAREGRTLVFVEVKTRTSVRSGHPLEAIGYSKLQRLRRLAGAWLSEHRTWEPQIRIDAIGIVLGPGDPLITHVEAAQ